MPVSSARVAAFDILLRVERESSYASELLHSSAYARLSNADHALATELVMGVLRWRSRLDQDIASASSQPLSKLDLEVVIALQLGLYQLQFLDRIPQRAALHESVELVKRARKRSAAPFVNAVLRTLAASKSNRGPTNLAVSVEPSDSSAATLSATRAHPLWLVERWVREYGLQTARQICGYNQTIPETSIRLRLPEAEEKLRQEGIALAPGALLASARRVLCGEIAKSRACHDDGIVVQDEGSQLVAAIVGSGPRILDCCAAPGGKTLAIADHAPDADIMAIELHPHRARLLQKLTRTSRSHIQIVNADARTLPISFSWTSPVPAREHSHVIQKSNGGSLQPTLGNYTTSR